MMDCVNFYELDMDDWGEILLKPLQGKRYPLAAEFEITERCNLGCVHCFINQPAGSHVQLERELGTEQIKEILDQIADAGCLHLLLTGGEPLLQPGFAEALLRLAREECLTTAIETCGLAPWAAWERVLPLLNTILFDFKHINPDLHREFTGVANDLILENLRRLIQAKAPLRIRIPLIPGFNADIQSARQMADYLSNTLLPNMPIDLLPYHTLGRTKYTMLSRPFPWQGVEPMKFETAQSIAEIFRSRNLSVSIGG